MESNQVLVVNVNPLPSEVIVVPNVIAGAAKARVCNISTVTVTPTMTYTSAIL